MGKLLKQWNSVFREVQGLWIHVSMIQLTSNWEYQGAIIIFEDIIPAKKTQYRLQVIGHLGTINRL